MSLKPAKIYPFTMGAGEALPLLVQGSYWKILSATGVLDVTGDTFGTIESIMPGQGLRGYAFQRLVIRDRSGSENMVRLLVADEQFVDDRITGEVAVIDGNKARSISGGAMSLRIQASSTSTGNRAVIQVMNPAGSGRRAIVDSIMAGLNVANEIVYGLTNAPIVAGVSVFPIVGTDRAGPASSVMKVNTGEITTFPTLAVAGSFYVPASSVYRVNFERPFVINPGEGFFVTAGAFSIHMINGAIEFFEEAML